MIDDDRLLQESLDHLLLNKTTNVALKPIWGYGPGVALYVERSTPFQMRGTACSLRLTLRQVIS